MPSISIIIPAYNVEKYIKKCLDSILNQTFTDYEVIVVDDCSTDKTYSIIQSYIPKFNNKLTLLKTDKNSGMAKIPRSIGLKQAKGEYVYFFDADDYLVPKALEIMYKNAKEYDADVVYCGKKYTVDLSNNIKMQLDSVGIKCRDEGIEDKSMFILDDPNKVLSLFFYSLKRNNIHNEPAAKLVRRQYLIDYNISAPNIALSDDQLWTIILLAQVKRFVRIPEALWYYRINPHSITHSIESKQKFIEKYISGFFAWIQELHNIFKSQDILKDKSDMLYTLIRRELYRLLDKLHLYISDISLKDLYQLCNKYNKTVNSFILPLLLKNIKADLITVGKDGIQMTTVEKELFLYNFSIGLIAKDEGHYIREWVEYYLHAGVDHFFIYDNDSTDNQKEAIQDYIDQGIVEYIMWPGKEMQKPMMADAIEKARYTSRYFTMVDVDEFIVPYHTDDDIPSIIDKMLENDNRPFLQAVGLTWAIYGTNGAEKADYSTPVLDRCPKRDSIFKRVAKYIMNPRMVKGCPVSPHKLEGFSPKNRYLMLNKPHTGIDQRLEDSKPNLILNHYRAKSKEEFEKSKVNRHSALVIGDRENNGGTDFAKADKNLIEDRRAIEYRNIRKDAIMTKKEISLDVILETIKKIISDIKQNYKTESRKPYNDTMERLLVSYNRIGYLKDKEVISSEEYDRLKEQLEFDILLVYSNKPKDVEPNSTWVDYEISRSTLPFINSAE